MSEGSPRSLSRVSSAQQSAASRTTAKPTSAAERLTQIEELRGKGLLTDAEYEEKRVAIVSGL